MDFFSAIRFLTILPIGRHSPFKPARLPAYFPLVGVLLGILLLLFDTAMSFIWPLSITALLDVIFLAILTGGFHLDGLGDAADGLLGHRSPEKALSVMKDSRIGVMGMLAILCVLLIKWAALVNLESYRGLFLVLIPALARSAMLLGIRFLPYGRPEGGTGHAFFQSRLPWRAFWALPILLAVAMSARGRGLLLLFSYLVINTLLLVYFRKRIGAITGDMLGTMTEINEAVLFLLMTLHGKTGGP